MRSSPNAWLMALCVVVLMGFQAGCESKQPPKKDKTTPAKTAADVKTTPVDDAKTKPAEDAKTKPADEVKPKPADKAEIKPPLGLPALPVPADNPITPEKIELGKMLYFDTRLSARRQDLLRHLPRSEDGLGRAHADQQGHQRPDGRPQLAHGDQRGLCPGPVLGRPRRQPRRAGPRARSRTPSKWATSCRR